MKLIFVVWIKGHSSYAEIWITSIVWENKDFLWATDEFLDLNMVCQDSNIPWDFKWNFGWHFKKEMS